MSVCIHLHLQVKLTLRSQGFELLFEHVVEKDGEVGMVVFLPRFHDDYPMRGMISEIVHKSL